MTGPSLRSLVPAVCLASALALAVPAAGEGQPAAAAPAPAAPASSAEAPARAPGVPVVHPNAMPDITVSGPYPRFTPAELEASGYPDHLHAFFWPTWRPLVGRDGRPYGPGSLCTRGRPTPGENFVVDQRTIAHGAFRFTYAPRFEPCEAVLTLELCEWARVRCRELLGLEARGTLAITDPDSLQLYQAATGYGPARLYKLQGDTCVIEPFWILAARTLLSHALAEMVAQWTLDGTTRGELPIWLSRGLSAYVADEGVHLNNFMAPLRREGPVLMRPAEIAAILSSPPDPDPQRDQALFRRASYSAFLMAWRLVENDGGLVKTRRLLEAVADGKTFAEACRRVYKSTPEQLAERLDPLARGEPIGAAVQQRQPNRPPEPPSPAQGAAGGG